MAIHDDNGWLRGIMAAYSDWCTRPLDEIDAFFRSSNRDYRSLPKIFLHFDEEGRPDERTQVVLAALPCPEHEPFFDQVWFCGSAPIKTVEFVLRHISAECTGLFSPTPGYRFPHEDLEALLDEFGRIQRNGGHPFNSYAYLLRFVNLEFDEAALKLIELKASDTLGFHHCEPIKGLFRAFAGRGLYSPYEVELEFPLVESSELIGGGPRPWLAADAELTYLEPMHGRSCVFPREPFFDMVSAIPCEPYSGGSSAIPCEPYFCFSAREGESHPPGTHMVPALSSDDIAAFYWGTQCNIRFELPPGGVVPAKDFQELVVTLASRWVGDTYFFDGEFTVRGEIELALEGWKPPRRGEGDPERAVRVFVEEHKDVILALVLTTALNGSIEVFAAMCDHFYHDDPEHYGSRLCWSDMKEIVMKHAPRLAESLKRYFNQG